MLYFLGAVVAILGAGLFLHGSISLRKRDEHSIQHYQDDAYASQTQNLMNHSHNNPY